MRFERVLRHCTVVLVLAGALGNSGCVNTPKPTPPGDRFQTAPAATISYDRDPVLDLLDYARCLHEATPASRAEAVGNARERANAAPGAIRYARLALAFGTAGQRRYTPDEAARYAQRALDADDAHWSPGASQYLADLARLYAKAARPPEQTSVPGAPIASDEPAPAQTAAGAAGAARDNERVRALEQQLDEARRKLRELANIEDRLSETGF